MIRVVCEECGKSYNYEVDDFCPKCGAYNRPQQKSSSPSATVRKDGVNEKNHAGSFVHAEVHEEKKVRQKFGLDQKPKSSSPRQSFSPPRQTNSFSSAKKGTQKKSASSSASSAITIIVWIIIVLTFVRSCAF